MKTQEIPKQWQENYVLDTIGLLSAITITSSVLLIGFLTTSVMAGW
jgi:hypothetical protein